MDTKLNVKFEVPDYSKTPGNSTPLQSRSPSRHNNGFDLSYFINLFMSILPILCFIFCFLGLINYNNLGQNGALRNLIFCSCLLMHIIRLVFTLQKESSSSMFHRILLHQDVHYIIVFIIIYYMDKFPVSFIITYMTLCFKRVFEAIGHDDFACHFGKYKRDVQSFCAKVYEFKQFNTIIAASELFFLLWFIFFAFISLKVMVLLFFYILTFTLFRYATDSE